MKTLVIIGCAVLFLQLGSSVPATVLRVPGQHPTIQAAINVAVDGDTVLVADGTYTGTGNCNIDFQGRAIVVMSESGPEVTVIDCQGNARGFFFHSGERPLSVVQGFTIRNGSAIEGGAILCHYSSPTIVGNTISYNSGIEGGGIYCRQGLPTILDNTITGNTAASGGGIACSENCSATIEGNTIEENFASGRGGGISCIYSFPLIRANTIRANIASAGGGIGLDLYSSPAVVSCTITENVASWQGGGIDCYYYSFPLIVNSILWADYANIGQEINLGGWSWIVVMYSDVGGGWPGDGNINADPAFVSAQKRDYRLLWESPCIDSGHPDYLDPDGTRSDMGAYFFNQNDYLTLYLTPDFSWVQPGDELGVTYTLINRWSQPEPFWVHTEAVLPNGDTLTVMGPDQHTLPADVTVQRHLIHEVPLGAPPGLYAYRSRIGVPPSTLYDQDSFEFTVVGP